MTRVEFISFLKEHKIPFSEYVDAERGLDQVWVYSKKEYEENERHPNSNIYVPYLRVSHFDEDRWYTRENGWCCYMNQERVISKCLEMGS